MVAVTMAQVPPGSVPETRGISFPLASEIFRSSREGVAE